MTSFLEILEAFLNTLYPHYSPLPAMTIAQFDVDPGRSLAPAGAAHRRRDKPPHSGRRWNGRSFRTAYDVDVWPVDVRSAALIGAGSLDLHSPCRNRPCSQDIVLLSR